MTGPEFFTEAARLVLATLALAAATADPFAHQPEWAEATR